MITTIDTVIAELKKTYEEAKQLSFIREPLGYALYQTWRKYDAGNQPAVREAGGDKEC